MGPLTCSVQADVAKLHSCGLWQASADIDSGDLKIDRASIRSLSPHQRNIGMVSGLCRLSSLNVEDNVGFGLKRLKLSNREYQANDGYPGCCSIGVTA